MRILIGILVIGLAAAAWWSVRDAPPPATAAAVVPAAVPAQTAAPAPSAPSTPIMFAPRPAETATAPTTAAPPTAIAPPAFSVVGAILFPGRKPALTLRVGGELRTLAEGDILEGYRVERIERERVVLVHVQSGSRVERGYGESDSSSPAPVVAAVSPASGPFAPPVSSVAPVPAQAAATTSTPSAPSAPYVAPRPPPGATVHDNPLVGAIIPSSPGQSPPGMSGPRPVPLAPGQAPPPGPVALPVPPNAQGPTSR